MEFIPQINQPDDAYFVQKKYASAFYKTDLQQLLTKIEVESIEICGAQTEYCVDSTIKVAHSLGYKLTILPNATTTIQFYENIWDRRFVDFI